MGQVYYRDWDPQAQNDITYNLNGSTPDLESWHKTPVTTLPLQPNRIIDNRPSWPYSMLANIQKMGYTVDRLIFYPVADTHLRYAPEQPIRKDIYEMLTARKQGRTVSGFAPTRSIYTGTEDVL